MTVWAKNPYKISLFSKYLVYYSVWKNNIALKRYNIKSFRVLTVTTTTDRVINTVSKSKDVNGGKGSRLFLFSDWKSLLEADDVLSMPWTNGMEESTRLID